jgi:hypothetical protein
MKTKKTGFAIGVTTGLLVMGAWVAGTGVATATLPIQKKAKELGFPATNCQYCHVDKLPKKGATTAVSNERGKWLTEQKTKRKVKEVDAAWLKDYVEKPGAEK